MRANLLRGVTKLPSRWSNDPGNKHYTKRKGFSLVAFFISQRVFCLHFSFQVDGPQGRVIVPYVAPFATSPALTRTHAPSAFFFLPRRRWMGALLASELAGPCLESDDGRRTSLLTSVVPPCISESLSQAVAIYLQQQVTSVSVHMMNYHLYGACSSDGKLSVPIAHLLTTGSCPGKHKVRGLRCSLQTNYRWTRADTRGELSHTASSHISFCSSSCCLLAHVHAKMVGISWHGLLNGKDTSAISVDFVALREPE